MIANKSDTTIPRLTAERLRHLIRYEPETGTFFLQNRFHKKLNGRMAHPTPSHDGYLRLSIDGALYAAHRLAWLYMAGEWPTQTVDHANLVKSDNRWPNLRLASYSQQRANSRKRADSSSPYKCVSWRHRQRKWAATVSMHGHRKHLGYFDTAEMAHAAYVAAAASLYGEFARAA